MQDEEHGSLSAQLQARLREEIAAAGGWIGFDRFMALALYAPGAGYYQRSHTLIGRMPEGGSDFVTAPELSPLFGATLARQVAQGLEASASGEVYEFGAGSGALAEQLLETLGGQLQRYHVVDLSGTLRARQRERLARFGPRVQWHAHWPEALHGVVLGNEVLDAMPVQLLHFDGTRWLERGVVAEGGAFAWSDRPTALRPPGEHAFVPGTVTEIHAQAEAFVRSLAERLQRGLALFIDYGFPEAEYYLPQRHGGTLMCHRAHRADSEPLHDVGEKDITAHVNFSGIALAAQDAGLEVLGYTSQGRFLFNAGLAQLLATADARARADALKLVNEHEMGELFKVIALGRGITTPLLGFAAGDRTHRL